MSFIATILVGGALLVSTQAACSDKNLVQNFHFRLSGNNLHFPCPATRSICASSGRYIPKNIIATRLQIYQAAAFVALPRYRPGVPFTVAKFHLTSANTNALLEPFPSWIHQEEGNCQAIQNAIDLFLDPLDRLWVLDIGICNTLEQPVKRCGAKIWGFDAESGDILKTINLENLVSQESRLQYLVVDYSPEGIPFAYISDAGTGAIVVLNLLLGTGYRVVFPGIVAVHCGSKDILYLQLARKASGNVLYFSYLSSPRLFSIKSGYLQSGQGAEAVVDVGGKPGGTQMVLLGTDNGGVIFFRYKGESDIYMWNSEDIFNGENFVLVQEGGDCRLATQVVPGWRNVMWAIESNFHDFITNSTGCLGATMAVYPLVKTRN